MTFMLTVDQRAWRAGVLDRLNAAHTASGHPAIAVVKGNGYGFGQQRLAQAATSLGIRSIAVGTVYEAADLVPVLDPAVDVMVLEPYNPADHHANDAWSRLHDADAAVRVTKVIADPDVLAHIARDSAADRSPGNRSAEQSVRRSVIIEGRTSMRRFGVSATALASIMADDNVRTALASGALRIRGLSLHLPLSTPRGVDSRPTNGQSPRMAEADAWLAAWLRLMDGQQSEVSVSHVTDEELSRLAANHPQVSLRLRAGSSIWLTDRRALTAAGTVLAVHPYDERTFVGYRQRAIRARGTVIVVSGGTAHGIGLTAPSPTSSPRQRITTAGTGVLDAFGRALSPFTWAGRQRWFIEPPHQHVSMLWLPRGCVIPSVGTPLIADVRFTTSRFDVVLGLD